MTLYLGSLNRSRESLAPVYKTYVLTVARFKSVPFFVISKMSRENVNKLKAVVEKANKSNINIQRLSAVENHLTSSNSSLFRIFILFPIIMGFCGIFFNRLWVNDEKCSISLPDSLLHAFRPPEDCSFCRNITQANRISNISPQKFEKYYAYNAKPVIITDATVNWTALDVFDFWYFKDVYDASQFESEQMNCQFFPVNTF